MQFIAFALPDIISSVSKGTKTGSENLQETEEHRHFRSVSIGSILVQRTTATPSIIVGNLQSNLTITETFRRTILRHSVAVTRVAVHADALPLLDAGFFLVSIFGSTEVSFFGLEVSVHANDGHGVGGVAVVAADGPVATLPHAVSHFCQMEFVQQVLVEAGVLVNCMVLRVTIARNVSGAVGEMNMGSLRSC